MDLLHEFTVPTDPDAAMTLLRDIERLAPCMPGAVLDTTDGTTFAGSMRLKVGAVQLTYRGTGRILPSGDDRELPLEFSATEARGAGGASAQVTCRVEPDARGSRVRVTTRLDITGKPAQFGRGVIGEIGDRVLGAFATNLAQLLSTDPGALGHQPTTASEPAPNPAPSVEPLDVMSVAGPVLVRRLLPWAAAVAAAAVGVGVGRWWGVRAASRSSRSRSHRALAVDGPALTS